MHDRQKEKKGIRGGREIYRRGGINETDIEGRGWENGRDGCKERERGKDEGTWSDCGREKESDGWIEREE